MPLCCSSPSCCARTAGAASKHMATQRTAEVFHAKAAKVLVLSVSGIAPSLRLEEEPIRVGAVDGRVTYRAGLIFLRQIMKCRSCGWTCIHSKGVTFQAE